MGASAAFDSKSSHCSLDPNVSARSNGNWVAAEFTGLHACQVHATCKLPSKVPSNNSTELPGVTFSYASRTKAFLRKSKKD